MTNPKGTRWETRLVDYLRPFFPNVERRARSGKNDMALDLERAG